MSIVMNGLNHLKHFGNFHYMNGLIQIVRIKFLIYHLVTRDRKANVRTDASQTNEKGGTKSRQGLFVSPTE